MKVTLSVPISVQATKASRFALNLNQYRNAHYFTLNNAKKEFEQNIKDILKKLPKFKYIELEYILYPKTKHLVDISNVCSIVDKFFSDSLTENGIIEDDNYNFITKITYSFGKIDPINPRCDVVIQGETYADYVSAE